jgi:two-component system, chemotaxis family, sensor kinase CheA
MQSLSQQVEQISATLVGVAPSDLQSLADAHSKFDQLLDSARGSAECSADTVAALGGITDRARKMLESLILNEVADADNQLAAVLQTIGDVQSLIATGKVPAAAPAPVPAAVATAPAPVAAAAKVEAEEAHESHADGLDEVDEKSFVEDELPLIQEFITESTTHLETAEQEMLTLEDDPTNGESLSSLFRAFHTIKGVAGFLDLKQIQGLAHVTEFLLDKGRSGKMALTGLAAELVLQAIDVMKRLVNNVAGASMKKEPMKPVPGVAALVRKLEDFLAGKIVDTAPVAAPKAPNAPAANTEAPAAIAATDGEAAAAAEVNKNAGDGTVKVQTDRLDRLIDMVGELVIANSMVAQDLGETATKDVRLSRHLGHLGKIVRELQDLSMSLRMVQVGQVFRKMTRVVRDTARKAMKECDLILDGVDTELDRNVVEALGDPLMHMVRNSVDHGIEPAEEREKAGKPRTGKIELKAYHKGGAINIEITDDGRGLNKEKILKKAIQNGLVREGEPITDRQIYELIFAAGLSTAEKVTDISGRGVGMDVVKRNIEKLRGRIEIVSTPGKGSIFTIRLPLTLAVIDGLVVKVGSQKYIVPINSIEQSIRPSPEMLSTVQGRGEIVTVRGSILPLVRLHELFAVEPKTRNPCESLVVIVQDNDRRACFLVDELLGQEQVVIKSLGEGMGQIKGISGGAVLGDGNVSLILDVPGLIDSSN